jgi:hypothetical protein
MTGVSPLNEKNQWGELTINMVEWKESKDVVHARIQRWEYGFSYRQQRGDVFVGGL